jgi:hypothetical protein
MKDIKVASLNIAQNLSVTQAWADVRPSIRRRGNMKTLRELLRDHERRLRELTSPAYEGATTAEVRAILIETCKTAIEQLKQDIEEETSALE